MKAEIISVGTELLLGHTINTDAAHVARALSSLGIDLHHACVVGDNAARLEECLRAALQRSDLVITTGGLGPTNDDLTKETVARVLGLPLEEDADSLRRLREYFGDRPVGENLVAARQPRLCQQRGHGPGLRRACGRRQAGHPAARPAVRAPAHAA